MTPAANDSSTANSQKSPENYVHTRQKVTGVNMHIEYGKRRRNTLEEAGAAIPSNLYFRTNAHCPALSKTAFLQIL